MSSSERPTVEGAEPPEKLAKLVNPIMKALLRSPLHWLVSKQLMLLAFSGRKAGKKYNVVVGRHEVDGNLVVTTGITGRRWQMNFRGGVPVVVTLEGKRRHGWGELVDDPEKVTRIHKLLLERVGLKKVGRLGLKVNAGRRPTSEELKAVLAGRGVIKIELDEVGS